MFVPRSTAYVIVAMLVVAWLLVSSVHLIQPQTSGEVTSPLKGGGGGLGGGIRITVPRMNLSTNFRVPRFEFQLPTLHLPQLKFPSWTFPFWGIGLGSGSGSGTGAGSGTGSGSANGSGVGDSSGSGSEGSSNQGSVAKNTVATTTIKDQVVIIPSEILVIIIIVIAIVSTVAFVSSRSRPKSTKGRKKRKRDFGKWTLPTPLILQSAETQKEEGNTADHGKDSLDLLISGREFISSFQGWGSQGGFLRPEINENLPLIWELNTNLRVDAPAGSSITSLEERDEGYGKIAETGNSVAEKEEGEEEGGVGKKKTTAASTQKEKNETFSVAFGRTCNLLRGRAPDGRVDDKWIRAVEYDEDVVKHFRLNLLSNDELEKAMETKTPREIVEEVERRFPEFVNDKEKLSELTRLFERAFYGRKHFTRAEYELFLKDLSEALANPKVIICGPK